MTYTSRLQAVTNLREWGMHRVRMFFGRVRPVVGTAEDTAITGDLLQDEKGKLWEFLYRENDTLHLKEV